MGSARLSQNMKIESEMLVRVDSVQALQAWNTVNMASRALPYGLERGTDGPKRILATCACEAPL